MSHSCLKKIDGGGWPGCPNVPPPGFHPGECSPVNPLRHGEVRGEPRGRNRQSDGTFWVAESGFAGPPLPPLRAKKEAQTLTCWSPGLDPTDIGEVGALLFSQPSWEVSWMLGWRVCSWLDPTDRGEEGPCYSPSPAGRFPGCWDGGCASRKATCDGVRGGPQTLAGRGGVQ